MTEKITTNIVMARFLRHGEPSGKEYAYLLPDGKETYEVGEKIKLNARGNGIITRMNVMPSECGCPPELLKPFMGKADPEPEIEIPAFGETKAVHPEGV